MKQNAGEEVRRSGKVHRRFPGLTDVDVDALNALDPKAAHELELLIRSQHRDEKRHRRHCTVVADLGDGALERLHGAQGARWSHGAGGGRRRPRLGPAL